MADTKFLQHLDDGFARDVLGLIVSTLGVITTSS
jgi:hypothetical protein